MYSIDLFVKNRLVILDLKTDGYSAIHIQNRALYHCRVLHKQGADIVAVGALLNAAIQLAPGGTAAIEYGFPASLLNPLFNARWIYSIPANIVKFILNTIVSQPVAGFFNGVAVFNTIDSDHGFTFLVLAALA